MVGDDEKWNREGNKEPSDGEEDGEGKRPEHTKKDWKQYTIRDRILHWSSILPLIISVLYMLYYLPVLGEWIFDHTPLGKYLFYNPETSEEGLFGTFDHHSDTFYIIRPVWLLLSFLALSVYGFALFMTDEQISELLKQPPEVGHAGHSALSRTSTFMVVTAVSQLLIFFFLLIFGYFDMLDRLSWSPAPEGKYSHVLVNIIHYNHEVGSIGYLFKGYIVTGYGNLNPISYLYIPNLIAAVALAYYTRNPGQSTTPSIPKWLNWAGVDDSEEVKARSDSTVNIDEAVEYGFDMLKGIAKYVIYVIILTAIGFIIIGESKGDGFFLLMGVPFIIAAMVIYISLAIGVMYKLWVDILARSRK